MREKNFRRVVVVFAQGKRAIADRNSIAFFTEKCYASFVEKTINANIDFTFLLSQATRPGKSGSALPALCRQRIGTVGMSSYRLAFCSGDSEDGSEHAAV